ncbi:major facilitator superfamily domain-containing protein [Mrakia frigida]|uniref:major facilitator superfamily domain-containing protein n=1 Tax=Mrakia frigida TaxID=29902 RepID=UPI003FCC202D
MTFPAPPVQPSSLLALDKEKSLGFSASQPPAEYPPWEKDSENPLNWNTKRKWVATLVVSLTGFMSTAASSMPAPASEKIGEHFGLSDRTVDTLVTSIFVLGLGFGPFLFAPISELYGRKSAYTTSTIPFALMNLSCIFAPSMPALIVLRFFAGVFASSGPSLGIATVSDIFSPADRGSPISIYAVGPMAGPVLGSMIGGWLYLAGYRWIFGLLTIISMLNAMAIQLFLRESYAPTVKYKLARLRREPPSTVVEEQQQINRHERWGGLAWMVELFHESDWKPVFKRAFTRPPRLLLLNPVCLIAAVYYAYIYGIIYLLIVTVPLLFAYDPQDASLFHYGWSKEIVPLAYLGLGFGFFSAAFTAAQAQNRIYAYLSKKRGDSGQPEYRLVLTQIGMIFFPTGWFIYGWSAHYHSHWMGPVVGLALCGYGLMLAFNSVQNFIVDFCAPYSAAGIAGATFLRSLVAFVLPLVGALLFERLGWGGGGSLLAGLSILALPCPTLMFFYGERLRERFKPKF